MKHRHAVKTGSWGQEPVFVGGWTALQTAPYVGVFPALALMIAPVFSWAAQHFRRWLG